jgi:hypothetical protein
VLFLKILNLTVFTVLPTLPKVKIINILLVDDVGVIVTERPETSEKDVLVVDAVSVLVVLTTCNTEPAGSCDLVIADEPVRIVPVLSGSVSVLFVLLLGLAIVNMPVPLALLSSFIDDIS